MMMTAAGENGNMPTMLCRSEFAADPGEPVTRDMRPGINRDKACHGMHVRSELHGDNNSEFVC